MNNALTTPDTEYIKVEMVRIREMAENSEVSDLAKPLRHLREKILQYPNRIPRDIDNAINTAIWRAQNLATRRVSDPKWDYTEEGVNIAREIFSLVDAVSENLKRLQPTTSGRENIRKDTGVEGSGKNESNREPVRASDDDTILSINGLIKQFKHSGFKLGPISFDLRLGEILGIVGANGSGKSTLLEVLRGALIPDSPSDSIKYPFIYTGETDWNLVRPYISYIGQRTQRWHGSVRENLEFAAALHGYKGEENNAFVDGLVARHQLLGYERHTWSQLSAGYRLRFEIALARIPRSRLFILDEPLANLDINSQQTFLDDIRQVATNHGARQAAVILSSQHIYEIEAVANRILILNEGKSIVLKEEGAYKTFEIWGSALDPEKLSLCMTRLGGAKPSARTSYYLIRLPAAVKDRDLVNALYEDGVDFTYFRDITRSVRILFESSR